MKLSCITNISIFMLAIIFLGFKARIFPRLFFQFFQHSFLIAYYQQDREIKNEELRY